MLMVYWQEWTDEKKMKTGFSCNRVFSRNHLSNLLIKRRYRYIQINVSHFI